MLVALLVSMAGTAQGGSRSLNAPSGFFGINLSTIPTVKDARRMARGGASYARYPFDWRAIQGQSGGPYDWGYTDATVEHLAASGMGVIPILYGSPSWLKPDYRTPPLHPAAARKGWRHLLTAAVQRYGPGGSFWASHPTLPYRPLRYWQIWNEPNLPGYFAPKASPRRYARLLHISAKALRAGSPRVKVVLGGMPAAPGGGGRIISWKFLNGLYAHGAKGDFDVVAVHPFAFDNPGMAKQLKNMRAVTRAHGQGHIPMWIDEIGWASDHAKWNPYAVGKRGQARKLRTSFSYVLAHRRALGITRLEWVAWRDRPAQRGCSFCISGLTDRHGHSKPAWRAYRHFSNG